MSGHPEYCCLDRVPLMISHPMSPYKGHHYPYPVELVDIYPTVNELLGLPFDRKDSCPEGWICVPLSGDHPELIVNL